MKIEFSTDNAAFKDETNEPVLNDICRDREVVRILKNIIDDIEEFSCNCGSIRDINGNKIGEWSL